MQVIRQEISYEGKKCFSWFWFSATILIGFNPSNCCRITLQITLLIIKQSISFRHESCYTRMKRCSYRWQGSSINDVMPLVSLRNWLKGHDVIYWRPHKGFLNFSVTPILKIELRQKNYILWIIEWSVTIVKAKKCKQNLRNFPFYERLKKKFLPSTKKSYSLQHGLIE